MPTQITLKEFMILAIEFGIVGSMFICFLAIFLSPAFGDLKVKIYKVLGIRKHKKEGSDKI